MEDETGPDHAPKYVYASIEQIVQGPAEQQYNVYGVVTECNAPRATRGSGK